jgi:hypothetical protein
MGSFAKIGAIITILGVVILAGAIMLTGLLENNEVDEVVLEVDYFNNWNVTLSHSGITESWSDMGRKETILVRSTRDTWVISVQAEKLDASSGYLRVRIKHLDGTVIGQEATNLPNGKISLVVEIP